MINITFPDGSVRAYESGVTGYEIAQSISPRLAAEVLAVSVKAKGDTSVGKGVTYDLLRPITFNASVNWISPPLPGCVASSKSKMRGLMT